MEGSHFLRYGPQGEPAWGHEQKIRMAYRSILAERMQAGINRGVMDWVTDELAEQAALVQREKESLANIIRIDFEPTARLEAHALTTRMGKVISTAAAQANAGFEFEVYQNEQTMGDIVVKQWLLTPKLEWDIVVVTATCILDEQQHVSQMLIHVAGPLAERDRDEQDEAEASS